MTKIDDGGCAFPGTRLEQVGTVSDHGFEYDERPTFGDVHYPGMTIRDWFAGQALAESTRAIWDSHKYEDVAKRAYAIADAMIAARKSEGQ